MVSSPRLFFGGALLFFSAILMGCGILSKEEYIASKFYDLGPANTISLEGIGVEFSPITSSSPCRRRMIYHLTDTLLSIDEYNRWIQPPHNLLMRHLKEAFPLKVGNSQSMAYRIEGDLICWDIYLGTQQVVLIAEFTFYDGANSELLFKKTYRCQDFFTENTPDAFALSFTRAATKLAQAIQMTLVERSIHQEIQEDTSSPAPTSPVTESMP